MALLFDLPVVLQRIDRDNAAAVVAAEGKDQDIDNVTLAAPHVVNVSQAMIVQNHWILDNMALLNNLVACLHGVDVHLVVVSSTRDQVLAAKVHVSRRLERRLPRLDAHIRHNFFWAAFRDNIHAFAQVLALLGQLQKYVAASSTDE